MLAMMWKDEWSYKVNNVEMRLAVGRSRTRNRRRRSEDERGFGNGSVRFASGMGVSDANNSSI